MPVCVDVSVETLSIGHRPAAGIGSGYPSGSGTQRHIVITVRSLIISLILSLILVLVLVLSCVTSVAASSRNVNISKDQSEK